jgi:hypothetical protein
MKRVHWAIRYTTFALSTFTLSLFFAGWREINTTGQLSGFVLLALGILLTTLLLMLQGYWIYFEEKQKGTLRRPSKMFEGLHAFLDTRFGDNRFVKLIQPVTLLEKEGSNQL